MHSGKFPFGHPVEVRPQTEQTARRCAELNENKQGWNFHTHTHTPLFLFVRKRLERQVGAPLPPERRGHQFNLGSNVWPASSTPIKLTCQVKSILSVRCRWCFILRLCFLQILWRFQRAFHTARLCKWQISVETL